MHGESSSDNTATVILNGSVGFSFTNMVDFNINSLSFTSYNRSWSYGSHPASNSALLLQSTQYAKLVNCSFHDNLGTALTVFNSFILTDNNEFVHNQCGCESFIERCKLGCAITALNSILTFTGNTTFLKNRRYSSEATEAGAGAILAVASLLEFNGTNNFFDNVGGAICITNNARLILQGTNNFINNSAEQCGGAIYTFDYVRLTFNGTNNFINNSAKFGGAINAKFKILVTFIGTSDFSNNSAGWSGGAIYVEELIVFTFTGTNNFTNNSAELGGGAIRTADNVLLTFNGINEFSSNSVNYHGGAIAASTNISLIFIDTSSFSSNSAMQGGAISAIQNSTLTFNGANSFTNNRHTTIKLNIKNRVSYGGAMFLAISSLFFILPHTTVHWVNNHANLGGAIYVYDTNPLIYCTNAVEFIRKERCFFQLPRPGQNLSGGQLVFKNNSADFAGSVLYGGAIDKCELNGVNKYSSSEVFDMLIINNDPDNNTTSNISSDPIKICPCKSNLPDCSCPWYYRVPHPVYPGETFQFSVVAVGQRNGTVSSTVRSTVTSSTTKSHTVNLLEHQYLQQTKNTCTKLNYTVFSLSQGVNMTLHSESSPCSKYGDEQLYFSVNLSHTCPPGFNISISARSCVCEPRLAQYTNHCNITNGVGQITRESGKQFWVGYDNSSHKLILHPYCPFDYCVKDPKVFPLNNTDVQCKYSRSGLLCGRCKEGYSLVLGSHQCRRCTNSHLALLIPFALMGVVLVFLLLVCKLTVATGTLSGLVFYANIVGVNRTIFLPAESTDALSVFIAWLNLDFGIETCFYNGLDTYSKTWLQFMFPVYIWVLVALMILISHYSRRFAKLLGNNPVSVLATLILLSYTKILRTLIIAVYITYLEYPQNYNRKVWLHDANIDYLVGKHIPLFLVSVVVFLFLFLPYTFLLLFGQWLQAISHLRLFSWVNNARLKPFMDSYHAPYKARHRYWPGLLLVLRFALLLVFAFNHQQNFSINLLAIVVGAGILQLWAWVSGGVYKSWCLDTLEGSFMLNLTILAAATYHVKVSKGNQLAVGYTSVSITLGTLIVIIFYHIFQKLRHTKLLKKVPKLNLKFKRLNTKKAVNNPINDPTESVSLDQLREPWLEDLLQPTHSSL